MGNPAGRPKQLTEDDVFKTLEEVSTPFVTSSMVAEQHDCSQATALNRLNELAEKNEVERYALDKRRSLYFPVDYDSASELIDALRQHIELINLDLDHLEAFAEQPYKLLPKSEQEYYLVVPRFVPFHAGHLHEQNEAWQVFVINKYVAWIEDLPKEIRERVDIGKRYEKAKVEDNILELANEEERDKAWEDLGGRDGGLNKRVDDNKIQIKRGKEFEIIARLIERGNLPFTTRPVTEEKVRGEPNEVSLRSYQERAWEEFKKYGQVGVYWPPGAGKTFLALYAGERLQGDKLVVVPTSTLEEQWQERIEQFCDQPTDND